MPEPADLSPTIVEKLYNEALELAERTRAAFDISGRLAPIAPADEDLARIALSCEALRTTTRMMHALAWLLNYRAYFAGELSDFQLRRNGRLPPPQADPGPEEAKLLPGELRALAARTRRFYERIEWLDDAWRRRTEQFPMFQRLHARLDQAVAAT